MPRRRHVLQSGAVGLAALAGCSTFTPGASESFSGFVDPMSATRLTVFTPNGDVTVEGTDTDTVAISGTKHSPRGRDDLAKVSVAAKRVGDTVQVHVEKTSQSWPPVRVDIDIDVPQELLTEHVRTGNGRLTLTNTRGSTTAETGNGRITMTDYAGYPRLTSGNGDITLTRGPGMARAWTGNGAVDAEIREIRDECVLGSGNGDLTARVADDLACTLELETGSGTVDTGDLDVSTSASRRGHLTGALNGGASALLSATTGNGDITLRPLDE